MTVTKLSGLTDPRPMIQRIKTLLGDDSSARSTDQCPDCGKETNPAANRCIDCIDGYDGGDLPA